MRGVETNTPQARLDQPQHEPVLLDATIELLAPQPGEALLDLTAGYGGHASSVLARLGERGRAVLVDRDAMSIEALQKRFEGDDRIDVRHENFSLTSEKLRGEGARFDLILLDLGVSSPQFDKVERGFSFSPGPIDMRMDTRQKQSAADIVNKASTAELTDILRRYGEEPKAPAIAKAIVASRPLNTTDELANLVKRIYRRRSKRHPATRTFQALRIATNDELGELASTLPTLIELTKPGGRIAVISFHSLEDRIVKQFLRENSEGLGAPLKLLTKRPISGDHDDVLNPRARSAKLRAAVKINTERG